MAAGVDLTGFNLKMPICICQVNIFMYFKLCAREEWPIIYHNSICANVSMRRPDFSPWLRCHFPCVLNKVQSTDASFLNSDMDYNFLFFQASCMGICLIHLKALCKPYKQICCQDRSPNCSLKKKVLSNPTVVYPYYSSILPQPI